MDREQPVERILVVGGPLDRDLGDLVADRFVALGANRDRNGHVQRVFRKLVTLGQVAAHRVARQCEDDVVDGDAELALELFHSIERQARPRNAPARAERAVEGGPRRHAGGGEALSADLLGHAAAGGGQVLERGAGALHGVERPGGEHAQRIDGCACLRSIVQRRGRVLGRSRREVGQQLDEPGPRGAVHQAVVDLPEQRNASALQALDESHLPQRARAIERLREEQACQIGEFALATGRGHGHPMDVLAEVELRGLHPVGPVESQRHLLQPPGETRAQRQALGHELDEAVELEGVVGVGAGIQDGDATDGQKYAVDARELLHGGGPLASTPGRPVAALEMAVGKCL